MFKMYKKILAFGCGMLGAGISQSALADHQFIYAGLMPTYSVTQFDWKNVSTSPNLNPATNGQTILDQTSSNTQIGAFIGYGVLIDKVYLGVEGAAQFGDRKATSQTRDPNTQQALNNTVTMSDIYIVDFRPGYVLNDKNTMIYGILGLNMASFNANQQNDNGDFVESSGSIRKNGIRLGLGYNLGLGRHFMARAEYAFTKFSDFQYTNTFFNGAETQTCSLNPYSNEVSLGLSVVFNV